MKKVNILFVIIYFCLFSCGPSYNCDSLSNALRFDECLLIVQKTPGKTDGKFNYKGVKPITKEKCDCNSSTSNRWWADYREYIEIGDTIIKKKGELIFSIHKKDTVMSFNFICDDKVYK